MLANFYKNPYRWAYTMETLAMICRVQDYRANQQNAYTIQLVERSLYSGHYCFALNGYHSGFMTQAEWDAYTAWFNFFVPRYCQPPQGFVYLRVEPDVAYERVLKRKRSSENKLSLTYLQQIHDYHEKFLIHKKNIMPSLEAVPVLVLDGNYDFQDNVNIFEQHKQKLLSFL